MAIEHGFGKDALAEAIPYIRRFHGITCVIKYGGSALDRQKYQHIFLEDIVFMSLIGMRVILVHGGSRHLNKSLEKSSIKTEYINGHRVTCDKILKTAIATFDFLNDQIVEKIKALGGDAVGMKGQNSELLLAQKHIVSELGYVGEIKEINTAKLTALTENVIPVITPIGVDKDGQAYNINADIVAARIAACLHAEKLILLTDVDGVIIEKQGAPPQLISSITAKDINRLIDEQVIVGGMKMKALTGLSALSAGVSKVHIINGSLSHSLLKELLTDRGIGTEILAG